MVSFGLVARSRYFCEYLELTARLEFLHVEKAAVDLGMKLRLLRGVTWGLSQFFADSQHDADSVGATVNRYFVDLLAGLTGKAIEIDEQRRSEPNGDNPTLEVVDAITQVVAILSHATILLSTWQQILSALDPELKTCESSDAFAAFWTEIPVSFPIAFDPMLVAQQPLRELKYGFSDAKPLDLCLGGRRMLLAGLYLSVFQPESWKSQIHPVVRDNTNAIAMRIAKLLDEKFSNQEERLIAKQCHTSTQWRLDWLNNELAPEYLVSNCFETIPTDYPAKDAVNSLRSFLGDKRPRPAQYQPKHPVGFLEKLVPIRVGMIGSLQRQVDFDRAIGKHVQLWVYQYSTHLPTYELPNYDFVVFDAADRMAGDWLHFSARLEEHSLNLRLGICDTVGNLSKSNVTLPELDEVDAPVLFAHIVCHPFFQLCADSELTNKLVSHYTEQERLRAIVNLACHILDRQMAIGARGPRSVGWIGEDAHMEVIESLKYALGRHLLQTPQLPEAFTNNDAQACQEVCQWLFRATQLEELSLDSAVQACLNQCVQFPALLLLFVLLVSEENDCQIINSSTTAKLSFRRFEAIRSVKANQLRRDLLGIHGLTERSLEAGLLQIAGAHFHLCEADSTPLQECERAERFEVSVAFLSKASEPVSPVMV